jgi:hypothetical protein
MELERLRTLRLSNPFHQFYIRLTDGRRLLVDQPYHLAVAPDLSHFIVSPQGQDSVHLRPDQVKDVDVLVGTTKS